MTVAAADADRAATLGSLWSDLAQRHVALGAACGCGMGGVSLRLEDFELDIVGYLEDAAARSGDPAIGAVVMLAADRDQPLRSLLDDILRGDVAGAVADWVLSRLERTLRSFAELHGTSTSR